AAVLEHPPRAELVIRVLEDAPERALVRRLRRLPLREQIGHRPFDLLRWSRNQPELDTCDDLTRPQARAAIGQLELVVPEPARRPGVDDEGPLEHGFPVAAVGARVHPYAA